MLIDIFFIKYLPEPEGLYCPTDTDSRGTTWHELKADFQTNRTCEEDFNGIVILLVQLL